MDGKMQKVDSVSDILFGVRLIEASGLLIKTTAFTYCKMMYL